MRKTYGILLAGILCFSCGCGYETEPPKTEQTEKIKLTILAGQSTSDAGTEDMLTEAIQEEFPDVALEWECADWGDGFDKCLQARFSAGDLPDIIIGKSQDVSSFAELELIDEIYLTNPEAIYEEALDTVCIDGKIYGLPYTSWYQGVLYNKDLFEKYGVQIPKTNEELKELVQFFEEHGEIAFASHFQESWKTGNLMMQLMLNEILKEDSDWGEDFRKGIHHYKDNPQIIWCLKELKYISEHSFSDCMLINQAECDRRFDEEMAAMYPGGCWSLQFVNQFQKDIHYGIFPYPVLEESDLIRETNMTFMKSAYTEKGALIDSIFDFLLEDEEIMQEILDFTQSYSINENIALENHHCISEDIALWQEKGRIVEASEGNSQLCWDYQSILSEKILQWLRGECSMEQVLEYADENRELS